MVGASRSGTRLIETDAAALDVLADLDGPVPAGPGVAAAGDADELVRAKRLALLRITARDLLGLADLEATTADLADVATAVVAASVRLARAEGLAVIGMGKLGGRELNYASDVDVMFVDGDARDARAVMDLARRCYRVDANLRPEGRDGALTRSVEGYRAYWERWAQPWEFQALLKAVPVAGDPEVGRAWAEAAAAALWGRRWTADDLRSLRALRDRAAAELRRQGAPERDVKRGPGGIRDIEFAVQTLQLVHGGADPELRSPTTLTALAEMARGGYVAADDADGLSAAYRFLRRVEHAVQVEDEQQTHTVPADRDQRRRVARVLGYRGRPDAGPTEAFDRDLARHRNLVRAVHERLYFRPLLDALAGAGRLSTEAAAGAPGQLRVRRRRADPGRGARADPGPDPDVADDAAAPAAAARLAVGVARPRPGAAGPAQAGVRRPAGVGAGARLPRQPRRRPAPVRPAGHQRAAGRRPRGQPRPDPPARGSRPPADARPRRAGRVGHRHAVVAVRPRRPAAGAAALARPPPAGRGRPRRVRRRPMSPRWAAT